MVSETRRTRPSPDRVMSNFDSSPLSPASFERTRQLLARNIALGQTRFIIQPAPNNAAIDGNAGENGTVGSVAQNYTGDNNDDRGEAEEEQGEEQEGDEVEDEDEDDDDDDDDGDDDSEDDDDSSSTPALSLPSDLFGLPQGRNDHGPHRRHQPTICRTLPAFISNDVKVLLPGSFDYPSSDANCVICMEGFNISHPPILINTRGATPCKGHMFGYECLRRWICSGAANSNKCPACRSVWFKASRREIDAFMRRCEEVQQREETRNSADAVDVPVPVPVVEQRVVLHVAQPQGTLSRLDMAKLAGAVAVGFALCFLSIMVLDFLGLL